MATQKVSGKQLVLNSGGGTSNYLRADGVWAAPGGGSVTGLVTIATRTALIAVAPPAAGTTYYLTEAGREGQFIFTTGNLSALVTADTRQGMYVAPSSDTTGATGAWVRKFSGRYDIRWFGGVADCTAFGVGTDNAPALNGMIALSNATGLRQVYIPAGKWRMSSRVSLTQGIQIYGDGFHENPGIANGVSYSSINSIDGTLCVVDQNVGFLIGYSFTDNPNASNALASLNANGVASTEYKYKSASGSLLKDFMVWSQGGTTVTAHGIEFRTIVIAENVRVQGFPGNGWQLDADTGGNGATTPYGIMDGSSFYRCHATTNLGHGFFIRGNDANTLTFLGCSSRNNGGGGYVDVSQLGNSYYLCHAATNNQSVGTVGQNISTITYSGTTATVTTTAAHGRTTGDKVNVSNALPAPYNVDAASITVINPTAFTYVMGSTPTTNATQLGSYFFNATSQRTTMIVDAPFLKDAYAGSYYANSQVGAHTYTGCYAEGGLGLKYSLEIGCIVLGGNMASPNGAASTSNLKMNVNGGGVVTATQITSADSAGAGTLTLVAGQVTHSQPTGNIIFRMNPAAGIYSDLQLYGAGSLTNGLDITAGGGGAYYSAGLHTFRNSAQSGSFATLDPSGFNLGTGNFKVAGTQVVSTRQTGTAANATDLASALTLVNDLKAKLVAHGLIS